MSNKTQTKFKFVGGVFSGEIVRWEISREDT
jgi:hypothetical protein